MSIAVKHIFWANIAGSGNGVFSKASDSTWVAEPLGTVSEAIKSGHLQVHHRIEAALDSGITSLSFAFTLGRVPSSLIVAYGCKVGAPDEMGRQGLVFTHCVEVGSSDQLQNAICRFLAIWSSARSNMLMSRVAALASGSVDKKIVFDEVSRWFEEELPGDCVPPTQNLANRTAIVTKIEHDCAGSGAIAWSLMGCQLNGITGPWEVFDQPGIRFTETRMIMEGNDAKEISLPASEVLTPAMGLFINSRWGRTASHGAAAPGTTNQPTMEIRTKPVVTVPTQNSKRWFPSLAPRGTTTLPPKANPHRGGSIEKPPTVPRLTSRRKSVWDYLLYLLLAALSVWFLVTSFDSGSVASRVKHTVIR